MCHLAYIMTYYIITLHLFCGILYGGNYYISLDLQLIEIYHTAPVLVSNLYHCYNSIILIID